MRHTDAFAWYMEDDPVLRSTIVAVTRLDRSPDWPRLQARITRLTRVMPTLRMLVQSPPGRIGPPRWAVDDAFDLDFHLRRARVAPPGGWEEVLEFSRVAAMASFDRKRPLWEFTLLEGLADGGAAFVTKLHHCLTDGIGGIQLASLIVDADPHGEHHLDPRPARAPRAPVGHPPSTLELTARTVADDVGEALTTANHVVRALPGEVVHGLLHPWAQSRAAAATVASVARFVAPINRPFSGLLGTRRTGRVLATVDVPVADLRAAAHAAGGRLNDAFLAALTEGLYRYHTRRGARLSELRVTVPISLRTDQDSIGGNRITLTRVRLPAGIADPAERIRRIGAVVRRWRGEPALGHAQEIAFGLNLLPRPYLGGVFKRVELLASDVPGIPRPVYLAGAQITAYYAFGPTIGAAANATLMSYAGMANVGINIDTGAVDNPRALVECVREGFADVLALASTPETDDA